jgi:hypothetical protein
MELRDRVRDGAASLAAEAGITIEHITKSHIRKEAIVARVLEQRGAERVNDFDPAFGLI